MCQLNVSSTSNSNLTLKAKTQFQKKKKSEVAAGSDFLISTTNRYMYIRQYMSFALR